MFEVVRRAPIPKPQDGRVRERRCAQMTQMAIDAY